MSPVQTFAATVAGSTIVVATADSNDFTGNAESVPAWFQNFGADVWLGLGPTVASSTGFKVASGAVQRLDLYSGDVVSAIGPTGGSGFRVIMTGVV